MVPLATNVHHYIRRYWTRLGRSQVFSNADSDRSHTVQVEDALTEEALREQVLTVEHMPAPY